MKITMISMYEFFDLNEAVEFWFRPAYCLMWRTNVTSYTIDNVKLTLYRERDVYFVGYEKEEQ